MPSRSPAAAVVGVRRSADARDRLDESWTRASGNRPSAAGGLFALFEREGDRFVGRGGLFRVESPQAVEINHTLDATAQGKG